MHRKYIPVPQLINRVRDNISSNSKVCLFLYQLDNSPDLENTNQQGQGQWLGEKAGRLLILVVTSNYSKVCLFSYTLNSSPDLENKNFHTSISDINNRSSSTYFNINNQTYNRVRDNISDSKVCFCDAGASQCIYAVTDRGALVAGQDLTMWD